MSIASARDKETKASPKTIKFYHAQCRSSFVQKYNSYLPKLERWQTKSNPDRYNSAMSRAYLGERNRRGQGGGEIYVKDGVAFGSTAGRRIREIIKVDTCFFFFSFVFYVYMQPLGYDRWNPSALYDPSRGIAGLRVVGGPQARSTPPEPRHTTIDDCRRSSMTWTGK